MPGPRAPLRALLTATRLLGRACACHLARRALRTPDVALVVELRLRTAQLTHENALLRERLARVPPRHRPHYTPAERWRLLELRALHGWSLDDTAAHALVTTTTIARWEHDASRATGAHDAAPPTARPAPPVRRFADVVRALVQTMDRAGVGGNALIARALARAGWRVSPETVRRIRRERPVLRPPTRDGHGLVARHPNHVWLVDLTTIPGLFGRWRWTLALILDAYARYPVAWRLSATTPTARQLQHLVQRAVRAHGRPRHLITDRGTQFTAQAFRRALRRLGIRQRFGAIGRVGSIALLERLWQTLKEAVRRCQRPPIATHALEARLHRTLAWYATVRPHTAHGLATPAEVYAGRASIVALRAPPRGRPGDPAGEAPYIVAHLDPDRTLPILLRRVA